MHHYTEEQAEKLKAIYPVGASVEVFLSTPHKGREFEVQSVGKIIKVDRFGVHAEVCDAGMNKEFVQILRPNHDRFVIMASGGVGPALTTQKEQVRAESEGIKPDSSAHDGNCTDELEVKTKFVPEPKFIQTTEEIAADERAVKRGSAPWSKRRSRDWSDSGGNLHRDDGPARLDLKYGERSYWQHGELHRMDGPAVRSQHGRNVEYWEHGIRARSDGGPVLVSYTQGIEEQTWLDKDELPHRDGAPAIMRSDGSMEWRQHGFLHRKDGPARIDADGTQFYFTDGVLGRSDDQPSVIYADGGLEWWEDDGRMLSKKLDRDGNDVTPRDAEGGVLPRGEYPEHMLPHGGNRTFLIRQRVRESMARG